MTHEERVERIRRQIDELPEEYRLMYAVEWLACAEAESDRNHRNELRRQSFNEEWFGPEGKQARREFSKVCAMGDEG
jgi:hypothetical protein